MKFNVKSVGVFAMVAVVAIAASPAWAAGGKAKELKHEHWHFDGIFGTYDADAVQRGFQVYQTVCASCHSLDLVAFRNLGDKGGPYHLDACPAGVPTNIDCSNPNDNPIVKAIAASYQIQDGPDDSGDMFQRDGVPSDYFPRPYANDPIARLANSGALPPDLSLIIKARHHGPDYVYSLLSGYEAAPETVDVLPGQYYNPYFPGDMSQNIKSAYLDDEGNVLEGTKVPLGGVLAMAPPLQDGIIDYADPETPETVEQYSKDVVEFLAWAAEPKMEVRKKLGIVTLLYLIILSGILYWSYREIWSKVEY